MIESEVIEIISTQNALLRTRILEPRSEPPYLQRYRPSQIWEHNSIDEEMYNWRRHFVGRSALEFKHCAVTINIRRGHELQSNLESFFLMWSEECNFLVKQLSVKWLVSACDTFADYSDDAAEQATALVGATLLKTIKIYETEMLFRFKKLDSTEWPEYKSKLLFDGFSTFYIGYGDVVYNLKVRIDKLVLRGTPAAMILGELFERVCKFDTGFSRWRSEHVREETRW